MTTVCNVVETSSDITLADDGRQFTVSFGDEGLVVDPTDKQVADADNLGQWYGLDDEAARNFRAMLRGELSSERWQKTKTALA
jgi:hypothetical protein